jgi:large conductance mechanosensitive channel
VYFIFVAPMNKINSLVKSRLATAEPGEEPIPADTALLAEIRDLLTQLAGSDKQLTSAGAASGVSAGVSAGAQPKGSEASR